MKKFYEEIENVCQNKKRVAMFIDMDGTIVEYKVYQKGKITINTRGKFDNAEPITPIINVLEKFVNLYENNQIPNYITILSTMIPIILSIVVIVQNHIISKINEILENRYDFS